MTDKYRAKRKYGGEWRYGYPCFSDEEWFLIDEDAIACMGDLERRQVAFAEVVSIDLDTLSRCSGLTACGQEVYEGDVMRLSCGVTFDWWTAVLRFGWHYGEYGWYLAPIRDTALIKRIGLWFGENRLPSATAEVIGNVWDNPEMMGVQT